MSNPLPSELQQAVEGFYHSANTDGMNGKYDDSKASQLVELFEQEYQRRSNAMLDRLESKHGEAIDYSLSQEPFKFVALSDIEAERGNLKQLSEGENINDANTSNQ